MFKVVSGTFAVVFTVLFLIFCVDEGHALYIKRQIAASPGVVMGTPVDTSRHRASHYRIHYHYRVDGDDYTVKSELISRDGRDIPAPSVLPRAAVAYSVAHPSAAALADEYLRRDPNHGVLYVLVGSIGAAALVAIPVALGAGWDEWKRKRKLGKSAKRTRQRTNRRKRSS